MELYVAITYVDNQDEPSKPFVVGNTEESWLETFKQEFGNRTKPTVRKATGPHADYCDYVVENNRCFVLVTKLNTAADAVQHDKEAS